MRMRASIGEGYRMLSVDGTSTSTRDDTEDIHGVRLNNII